MGQLAILGCAAAMVGGATLAFAAEPSLTTTTAVAAILVGAGAALVLLVAQLHAAQHCIAFVGRVSATLKKASAGNLNTRVINLERNDELGDIAHHANRMLDLVEAFAKESGAAMEYAGNRKYYRKIVLTGLRGEFVEYSRRINSVIDAMAERRGAMRTFGEKTVSPAAEFLSGEAASLSAQAAQLRDIAQATIAQARAVSQSAEMATGSVETVASATEELSASIGEINRQTGEATRIAATAVEEVGRTNETVSELDSAAQKIGEVVELIRRRRQPDQPAGAQRDHRGGPARARPERASPWVANEVKNLANQTARATEDITAQVAAMQSIAANTVGHHPPYRRDHRPDGREHPERYRRGAGAGGGDGGNLAQRPRRGAGHPHRRRADRSGLVPAPRKPTTARSTFWRRRARSRIRPTACRTALEHFMGDIPVIPC